VKTESTGIWRRFSWQILKKNFEGSYWVNQPKRNLLSLIRKVGRSLPVDTASHPKEPQMSNSLNCYGLKFCNKKSQRTLFWAMNPVLIKKHSSSEIQINIIPPKYVNVSNHNKSKFSFLMCVLHVQCLLHLN
jgi:hypothetical protein